MHWLLGNQGAYFNPLMTYLYLYMSCIMFIPGAIDALETYTKVGLGNCTEHTQTRSRAHAHARTCAPRRTHTHAYAHMNTYKTRWLNGLRHSAMLYTLSTAPLTTNSAHEMRRMRWQPESVDTIFDSS